MISFFVLLTRSAARARYSATVLADVPPPPSLWLGICMVAIGSCAYGRAPKAGAKGKSI